jgi:hypothetical protein
MRGAVEKGDGMFEATDKKPPTKKQLHPVPVTAMVAKDAADEGK